MNGLSPVAIRAAELRHASDDVRLAFLAEEHVLVHSRMKALLDELATIVTGPSPEKKSRLVTARSFNGKSTTAQALRARFPFDMNPLGDAARAPVVVISMPEVASVREFSLRVLRAVSEPANERWSGTHLLSCAYACLRALGTKALVIDEFQQLGQGRAHDRQQMTNVVKSIGAQCGLAVFGFGMPDGIALIEREPQLQRRFEHRVVLPWEYGVESGDLVADLEALLPLRERSGIRDEPALLQRVLELGDGVIGHIRTVMIEAARTAIISGREVIDGRTLDGMTWVPPGTREEKLQADLKATPRELGLE